MTKLLIGLLAIFITFSNSRANAEPTFWALVNVSYFIAGITEGTLGPSSQCGACPVWKEVLDAAKDPAALYIASNGSSEKTSELQAAIDLLRSSDIVSDEMTDFDLALLISTID